MPKKNEQSQFEDDQQESLGHQEKARLSGERDMDDWVHRHPAVDDKKNQETDPDDKVHSMPQIRESKKIKGEEDPDDLVHQ